MLISIRLGKRRCLVITDSNVGPLYQKRLEAVLAAAGHDVLPGSRLKPVRRARLRHAGNRFGAHAGRRC